MVSNRNKCFPLNRRGEGQWFRNPRPCSRALSPFRGSLLRLSLTRAVLGLKNEQNVKWWSKMKVLNGAPFIKTSHGSQDYKYHKKKRFKIYCPKDTWMTL